MAHKMTNKMFPISKYIIKRSKYLNEKMFPSIILLAATIAAFIWANSPYSDHYFELLHIPISIGLGNFDVSNTLIHWINDGLMTIFFFVIGLEIKREILVGELSNPKKVVLPAVAALGGVVTPALMYMIFNYGGPGSMGWGITIATDIAFALGCLVALGKFIPLSLRVFLLTLAIFDDIGAILVIAVFYTDKINLISLAIGFVVLIISVIINIKGVRKTYPYVILGIIIWAEFLFSGVHATIAGVLLALTIPARSLYTDQKLFLEESRNSIQKFPDCNFQLMVTDKKQRESMKEMKCILDGLDTPLQNMEDKIYPFSNYFILPLFAFANAGVNISQGAETGGIFNPISLGIIIGLIVGKPLGILIFSWLSVKLGLAELPQGVKWKYIAGVACFGGIGFTMSLFITNLAFADPLAVFQAKIAILIGSTLSAIIGFTVFAIIKKQNKETNVSVNDLNS